MKDKENFATKCGRWFANLLIGCLATCLSAIVISLTVRFIMWLI